MPCDRTDRLALARRITGCQPAYSSVRPEHLLCPWRLELQRPSALFFALLRLSQSFRAFVLSLDLRLIAGMQAWRWAGLGFLSLYAHNVLPAVFALPAGLGDMAIGATAPWIILKLVREPRSPPVADSSVGMSSGYWTSSSRSASEP